MNIRPGTSSACDGENVGFSNEEMGAGPTAYRSSSELVLDVEDLVDVEVALGQRSLRLPGEERRRESALPRKLRASTRSPPSCGRWPRLPSWTPSSCERNSWRLRVAFFRRGFSILAFSFPKVR